MDKGHSKVYVVTGTNKGIGYHIVEQLATAVPDAKVVMTSRDLERGKKALEELLATNDSFKDRILLKQLDIASSESIDKFVATIKEEFQAIDGLINNAGILPPGDEMVPDDLIAASKNNTLLSTKSTVEDYVAVIDEVFNVNWIGTMKMAQGFLPLIKEGGTLVNVSSRGGLLACFHSEDIKNDFQREDLTEADLQQFVGNYRKAVRNNTHESFGVPQWSYGVSKALLNASTRILARDTKRNVKINYVCPGWCRTDLGGKIATLSAAQGAETPVYLATLAPEENRELTGKFWAEKKQISYVELGTL